MSREKKGRKSNTRNGKAEGSLCKRRKISSKSRAREIRQSNWKGISKNKENHTHTHTHTKATMRHTILYANLNCSFENYTRFQRAPLKSK